MWLLCEPKGPGRWLLCEPKGPGYQQVHDCCVNPKDQETPGGWLLCEPKGPGDHQEGDCCVNPEDLEITRHVIVVWTQGTRQVIVVWTQRTRISAGAWLLCEPKGPGDHQAGDCCRISVCENGCRAHTTFPFCWRTISGKSWRRCFQIAKQPRCFPEASQFEMLTVWRSSI